MLKVSAVPHRSSDPIHVALASEQSPHPIDERRLVEAVVAIIDDSKFCSANISVAVVDDVTMQELNRRHLGHDYPTDVLSFVLEDDGNHLEGEVIISADMAAAAAAERGCPAAAEQLLYAIHGTLHLVGYRDKTPGEIAEMRTAEDKYLSRFGFSQKSDASDDASPAESCEKTAMERGESGW